MCFVQSGFPSCGNCIGYACQTSKRQRNSSSPLTTLPRAWEHPEHRQQSTSHTQQSPSLSRQHQQQPAMTTHQPWLQRSPGWRGCRWSGCTWRGWGCGAPLCPAGGESWWPGQCARSPRWTHTGEPGLGHSQHWVKTCFHPDLVFLLQHRVRDVF